MEKLTKAKLFLTLSIVWLVLATPASIHYFFSYDITSHSQGFTVGFFAGLIVYPILPLIISRRYYRKARKDSKQNNSSKQA